MGEHAAYIDAVRSVGPSSTTPAAVWKDATRSRHTAARPTIRIIHIVAPEIIKTDAANFRDLVQRLTGRQQRPAEEYNTVSSTAVAVEEKEKLLVVKEEEEAPVSRKRLLAASDYVAQERRRKKKIKCEVVKVENASGGFGFGGDLDLGELWMDNLKPEGFLSIFEQEDIFRGMADSDLLLQPFMGAASRMDFVSEMCSSYLA